MILGKKCDVMYGCFVVCGFDVSVIFDMNFDVNLMVKNMTSIDQCYL